MKSKSKRTFWWTGKHHSEEAKRRMRGRHFSEETREKMSKAKSGYIPWNKGKIGIYSKETIEKMSKAHLGKHPSKKTKQRMSKARTGVCVHSKESKKKISEAHMGERNPAWKGGITPLVKQVRQCFKYRQWRSDIFTRDDFTCVLCGQQSGQLETDHYPKSFSKIFHEYKIKNIQQALDCEEFWNINNGRTLCKKCHRP